MDELKKVERELSALRAVREMASAMKSLREAYRRAIGRIEDFKEPRKEDVEKLFVLGKLYDFFTDMQQIDLEIFGSFPNQPERVLSARDRFFSLLKKAKESEVVSSIEAATLALKAQKAYDAFGNFVSGSVFPKKKNLSFDRMCEIVEENLKKKREDLLREAIKKARKKRPMRSL